MTNAKEEPAGSPGAPPRRQGVVLAAIIASAVALVVTALVFGLLPRARELAKRVVESKNLRSIGEAVLAYSESNGGAAPGNLQALVTAGLLTPKQLLSSSSGHNPPACDYDLVVYAPSGGGGSLKSDWILAYSDPQLHQREGANILFLDGHVEFVKEPEFSRKLAQFRREYEEAFGEPPKIIPRSPQAP
jgi:prepilin-type processing-associated H-X9-DG protein